ncbi:MAG: 2,3,4,5-tetrahydropyridine-2,6-dicarboxylate N-succinyltransferase [Candidatus Sumerlaeia bacterium]|nr:2,3,4,5-tetrahydropyridine-2,6-dicarboxylate N-succinyltransferase [Candidatus Sumerlaeia bacterium]
MTQETAELEAAVAAAWNTRGAGAPDPGLGQSIDRVLRLLESGELRVAEKGAGGWEVRDWVRKAVLLYFRTAPMRVTNAGPLQFHDKIRLLDDWQRRGVRVVPPTVVREGAHIAPGAILMPCFVNIGAYVGARTMIDSFATVGSCAQVGADCHVSAGVVVGGVLEPLNADPVIIEDRAFVGANSSVLEGVHVGEGAVLAPGCHATRSTRIIDEAGGGTFRGEVPAGAVVVPGAYAAEGSRVSTYALVVKKYRDPRTDAKVELNELLR